MLFGRSVRSKKPTIIRKSIAPEIPTAVPHSSNARFLGFLSHAFTVFFKSSHLVSRTSGRSISARNETGEEDVIIDLSSLATYVGSCKIQFIVTLYYN